ncbi:MAG: acetoin utilization protein AcuC [Thermodesulfobacteriota bacterium]
MHSRFYYSQQLARFDFGPDHPFKPERAQKAHELCNRYGVLNHPHITLKSPPVLDKKKLLFAHSQEYLDALKRISEGELFQDMLQFGLGTEDNPPLKGIYEWSVKCAGATWEGMMSLLDGSADIVFNPLGGFHHARRSQAEGFCYINDLVIAIEEALCHNARITYLDIDAHHGNGVQEAFYREDRVQVISLHESGKFLYPYSGNLEESGEGKGRGFTINIPFPPKTDDELYLKVFHRVVIPLIKRFEPDFLVAEIGADTMISDPLTDFMLTNNSYTEVIRNLKALSEKILATGGGGYDIYRTARCWTLAWAILNDIEPVDEFAGLVGGMMFGPEMEVSSLHDRPYTLTGPQKDTLRREVDSTIAYLIKRHNL